MLTILSAPSEVCSRPTAPHIPVPSAVKRVPHKTVFAFLFFTLRPYVGRLAYICIDGYPSQTPNSQILSLEIFLFLLVIGISHELEQFIFDNTLWGKMLTIESNGVKKLSIQRKEIPALNVSFVSLPAGQLWPLRILCGPLHKSSLHNNSCCGSSLRLKTLMRGNCSY